MPGSLFNRSARIFAKASVMVFSGVFVPIPVAPASMPPCPASTATVKILSPCDETSGSGVSADGVDQSCVLTRLAKTSFEVISASSTSR
ncbi:Uncharacterised protein [Mycobacterium tuberculosis]|nr:Uncharacterised protein [Mycobacterium tuberculosis]